MSKITEFLLIMASAFVICGTLAVVSSCGSRVRLDRRLADYTAMYYTQKVRCVEGPKDKCFCFVRESGFLGMTIDQSGELCK